MFRSWLGRHFIQWLHYWWVLRNMCDFASAPNPQKASVRWRVPNPPIAAVHIVSSGENLSRYSSGNSRFVWQRVTFTCELPWLKDPIQAMFQKYLHRNASYCWWFRNPAWKPVEVGSLFHYLPVVFIDLRWFSLRISSNRRKRDVNPRTAEVPEPRIPRSQLTPRGTLVSSLHPETHRLLAWRNRLPQMMGLTSLASNLRCFFSFLKVACPTCAFVLFLGVACILCSVQRYEPVWC